MSIKREWVGACVIAESCAIVSIFPLIFLAFITIENSSEFYGKILRIEYLISAGIIEGGLIGLFQSKIIEKYLNISRISWTIATISAAIAGWLSLLLIPTFANHQFISLDMITETIMRAEFFQIMLFGLAIGMTIGIFQGFLMKKLCNNSIWAFGNILGWTAGVQWLYFAKASILNHGDSQIFTFSAIIITALLVVFTASYINSYFLAYLSKSKGI